MLRETLVLVLKQFCVTQWTENWYCTVAKSVSPKLMVYEFDYNHGNNSKVKYYMSRALCTFIQCRARILEQITIYRRLRIGQDGPLDQSGAYDIS